MPDEDDDDEEEDEDFSSATISLSQYSNLPSVVFNEVAAEKPPSEEMQKTTNIQKYNWKEVPTKALLACYDEHKGKFNNINYI